MDEIKTQFRRILVVDDDIHNLKLATGVLGASGYAVDSATDGKEALAKSLAAAPHLVLLDINMPGLDGIKTMAEMRTQLQDYVSVILVSARSDIKDVVHGLDCGADDYLRKPYDPRELLARVRAQLRIKDLRDELQDANEQLKELVDVDDLTGLYNMRSIYSKIETELHRAKRFHRSIALVMLDMDQFKKVNDNHDHLFGSFVLKEVGNLIKKNLRQADFAARYGGDEFLIVLTETDETGAAVFTERLRQVIEDHIFISGKSSVSITASLGVAVTDPEGEENDAQGVVRAADHALYDSKAGGRNCAHLMSYFDGKIRKIDKGFGGG